MGNRANISPKALQRVLVSRRICRTNKRRLCSRSNSFFAGNVSFLIFYHTVCSFCINIEQWWGYDFILLILYCLRRLAPSFLLVRPPRAPTRGLRATKPQYHDLNLQGICSFMKTSVGESQAQSGGGSLATLKASHMHLDQRRFFSGETSPSARVNFHHSFNNSIFRKLRFGAVGYFLAHFIKSP